MTSKNGAKAKKGAPQPPPSSGEPTLSAGNIRDMLKYIDELGSIVDKDFKLKRVPEEDLTEIRRLIKASIEELSNKGPENSTKTSNTQTKQIPKSNSKTTGEAKSFDDLRTTVQNIIREKANLNKDLLHLRKDLNESNDKAVSLGAAFGVPENPTTTAKDPFQALFEKNKKLCVILDRLNKGCLESSCKPQASKPNKKPGVKNTKTTGKVSKGNKEPENISESNTASILQKFEENEEKISEAVERFSKLKECESEIERMAELAKTVCTKNGILPTNGSSIDSFDFAMESMESELHMLKETKSRLEYRLGQVLFFAKNMKEEENVTGSEKVIQNANSTISDKNQKKKDTDKDKKRKDGEINPQATDKASDRTENYALKNIEELDKVWSWLEAEFKKVKHDHSSCITTLSYIGEITTKVANHSKNLFTHGQEQKIHLELKDDLKQNEVSNFNKDIHEVLTTMESFVKTNENYSAQIKKQEKDLAEIKAENESLQLRLSKLAGTRLTEGNPSITNLGDPNRPMKIGEAYSELYDNEWTDAMDFFVHKLGKNYEENKVLHYLYEIITGSYKYCEDEISKWMEGTKLKVKHFAKDLDLGLQQEQILKNVVEIWKASAETVSENSLQNLQKQQKNTKQFKGMDSSIFKVVCTTPFFSKCFKICWKMLIQEPSMVLDEGPLQGNSFDRTIFREYTSSGTKVVFTVWPALFLHKNGPLLIKGVVKVK